MFFNKKSIIFVFQLEEDAKFQSKVDRVEAAFEKFDKDGDGFIDWEEFQEVKQVRIWVCIWFCRFVPINLANL